MFFLDDGVESLVLILHFAAKTKINQHQFSSAFQTSDCKQQVAAKRAAHDPQGFLEFVNSTKGGGAATRKSEPIPQFGGFS